MRIHCPPVQIALRVTLITALVISCHVMGRMARKAPADRSPGPSDTVKRGPVVSHWHGRSISEALDSPNLRSRTASIVALVSSLKTNDQFIDATAGLEDRLEETEVSDALFLLADAWGSIDPESAAAHFSKMKVPGWRSPFIFAVLGRWAQSDQAAARDWIEKAHPQRLVEDDSTEADRQAAVVAQEAREYYLVGVIRGLAATNPQKAMSLWMELSQGPSRSSALEFVVSALCEQDAAKTRNWISRLPDDQSDTKAAAIRIATTRIANGGTFQEYLQWADGFELADDRNAALVAIAERHAKANPQQTSEWALSLEGPGLRQAAVAEAVEQWARIEPENASAWLDAQQPSFELDHARRKLAATLIRRDVDVAFQQVSAIKNESLRYETSEQLGRMWIAEDPEMATAYIRRSRNFNASARRSLLELVD